MATGILSSAARIAGAVGLAVYVNWNGGALRDLRPLCSWLTCSGLACKRSISKRVDSQTSRKSRMSALRTSLAPWCMWTFGSTSELPITTHGISALWNATLPSSAAASATSITSPSSSQKRKAIGSMSAGSETSIPLLPANAISRRVVTKPPSLRSCPALISPSAIKCCTISNARASVPASSRFGHCVPS